MNSHCSLMTASPAKQLLNTVQIVVRRLLSFSSGPSRRRWPNLNRFLTSVSSLNISRLSHCLGERTPSKRPGSPPGSDAQGRECAVATYHIRTAYRSRAHVMLPKVRRVKRIVSDGPTIINPFRNMPIFWDSTLTPRVGYCTGSGSRKGLARNDPRFTVEDTTSINDSRY